MQSLPAGISFVLVLAVGSAACGTSKSGNTPAQAGQTPPLVDSIQADTAPDAHILELLAADSARSDADKYALIRQLLPTASQPPNTDSGALALIRIGWLKLRLNTYQRGGEFDRVRSANPSRHWASDDAEWALAFIDNRGACTPGNCAPDASAPLSAFIGQHPTSPYVPRAIELANSALSTFLGAAPARDLTVAGPGYDPAEFAHIIESYDNALANVPRAVAAKAVPVVGRAWEMVGRPLNARAVYQWALAEGATDSPDTLRAQIARIPAVKGFMVAILRNDSVMIPFAVFDDSVWRAPWIRSDTGDVGLSGMPYAWFDRYMPGRRVWYYWEADGTRKVLTASRTVRIDNHCETNWGILTNYPGKTLEKGDHHDDLGVVLEIDQRLDHGVELKDTNGSTRSVKQLVQNTFESMERDAIAKSDSGSIERQLPPEATRATIAVVLQLIQFSAAGDRTLYAFQAKREYPTSDQWCKIESVSLGWIVRDESGRLTLLQNEHGIDDCRGKSIPVVQPLGSLIMNGRTFLFEMEHGWENEAYVILELTGAELRRVRTIYGGGC